MTLTLLIHPEQEVEQLRDMTRYIRKNAKEEVIAIRRKRKKY